MAKFMEAGHPTEEIYELPVEIDWPSPGPAGRPG